MPSYEDFERLTAERDRYRDELGRVQNLIQATGSALGMAAGTPIGDIPAVAGERHLAARNLRVQLDRALAEQQRLQSALVRLRELDEQRDRVWADLDTVASAAVPGPVDPDRMLTEAREELAHATDRSERIEAVRDLLADWYAAWPAGAVTDPHEPLAWMLVDLLAPPANSPPTARPTVTVERPDDEIVEVYVNGEAVASANHDEHGWSGMDAVVRTALAVARALGGAVRDEDPES